MDFMSYIKKQFKKYQIPINKEHNFYFKINYFINLLPKWIFIRRKNEHYIPKNYYQFLMRLLPFYFIITLLKEPIKKITRKIKVF